MNQKVHILSCWWLYWKIQGIRVSYYNSSWGDILRVNVYNEFYINPSDLLRHFPQHHKCQPPKSVGFILWGTWMVVPNFMAIPPIFVEIFQSGIKWWTSDWQTDIGNVRAAKNTKYFMVAASTKWGFSAFYWVSFETSSWAVELLIFCHDRCSRAFLKHKTN